MRLHEFAVARILAEDKMEMLEERNAMPVTLTDVANETPVVVNDPPIVSEASVRDTTPELAVPTAHTPHAVVPEDVTRIDPSKLIDRAAKVVADDGEEMHTPVALPGARMVMDAADMATATSLVVDPVTMAPKATVPPDVTSIGD